MALCLAALVLLAGCQGAEPEGVSVDYGESELYTRADMDAAVDRIWAEFSAWEGCSGLELAYEGDEAARENLGYCNELAEGEGFTECIVFTSAFHSPKEGGGAWNPDADYAGWQWYLARREGGPWRLLTWGYG